MGYDVIVIGTGPNGLAAAIELARAGRSVCVFEAANRIGGGVRSAELTLPGFLHDVCSAIHPLAVASPFFRSLPLSDLGLEWVHAEAPVAHPFIDGHSIVVERSMEETERNLTEDGVRYRALFGNLTESWEAFAAEILAPLHFPSHPILFANFARYALSSARSLAFAQFRNPRTRALFAGMAAHSVLPMETRPSAAFGIVLTVFAHAVGWPFPRGGSQQIPEALATYLRSLGGRIETGILIRSLDELPRARMVFCDVTPRQLRTMVGDRLPDSYRRKLQHFRYGPGVFKVDWALSSPIPWKDKRCNRAATLHIGGTFEEIAWGEHEVSRGRHPERPFVIVTQTSLFDETRAPSGKQLAWAYCHVPNGSTDDMTNRIETQVEQFAPGFRDCILGRSKLSTADLQAYNPNYVGGDINGGLQNLLQLFARPVLSLSPYRTPAKGVYICSSSTPPGGGVHGMCGFHAARAALSDGYA